MRVRAGALPAQLLPLAAERPLTVKRPAVEKKKQAQDSPASLIGTDFVEMLPAAEQLRECGKHEGHRRERGDEKCGQPKPPLAPREFPQAGFRLLHAERICSLKRRGIGFAGAKSEY